MGVNIFKDFLQHFIKKLRTYIVKEIYENSFS